ncbi:heat-shock protein [Tamlana sedimentorum]|uniref:Heat-shock protein n=1 Tax=Neotamlana sedimentorum TaxID=1435349 RepID=A0A0D7WAD4_9FLAO|nr:TetR family transcriptional regulator C-terminal domain-containing protein [Tamlana sedimentorum]KJD36125.1 heat-shock protein [Tamlana sedimentorum]
MAKKKTVNKNDIISLYMDYVLEYNENPKTVYAFCKANNFNEADFYNYFASFEAIEKGVFEAFYTNTINVLDKSDDYKTFDARNKLLSFYFTFFEILTSNRSYVVYVLNNYKNKMKGLKKLMPLKKHFTHYIQNLNIETLDLKQEKLEKLKNKTLEESAWVQLILTIEFWLNDTSSAFEKTDIFIEKSVNTSFDLLNVSPLKSVVDFGKFLYKEKFQFHN